MSDPCGGFAENFLPQSRRNYSRRSISKIPDKNFVYFYCPFPAVRQGKDNPGFCILDESTMFCYNCLYFRGKLSRERYDFYGFVDKAIKI